MQKPLSDWKAKGSYFSFKGNSIFYIKDGAGPTLAIFHGYPYNSFDFEKIWGGLTAKFTVVALDMLGMGFSDKPEKHHYSFDEMADLYTALLKELKIDQTHILAHDLGNSVVQELIARENVNPFLIKSIAFLNGGLFSDVYRPRLIQVLLSQSPKPVGRILSRLMSRKSVFNATSGVFGSNTKPSEELLEIFWDILNYNNGKAIAYLIGRLVFEKDKHQQDWIRAMQQTKIPLCFINGPADPNSGIHMAMRYKELIPSPIIFLLDEKIGHWPQLEAPQEVLDSYLKFISVLQMN